MRWVSGDEEAEVIMDGNLNIWCEKLPPFNLMPTKVLQGGSNAVLGAAVRTIQRVSYQFAFSPWLRLFFQIFMDNLMKDYEQWANDPEYRAERAQASAKCNPAPSAATVE